MSAPALRVVTFNIRNGRALDGTHSWPFRRRAVAGSLARLAPDVAGLQEVYGFQQRWLARRLPELAVVGAGRTDGRWRGERCPLLVRGDRLAVVAWETRWYAERPGRPGGRLPGAGAPRVATIATVLDRAVGERFVMVDTHLDEHHAANRTAAAELLVSWLDLRRPTVVVGDLNVGPGDAVLAVFEAAGLAAVVPAGAGGSSHPFDGRTDGTRLDHVLATGQWSVLDAGVDYRRWHGALASDDWPVWADLRLSP